MVKVLSGNYVLSALKEASIEAIGLENKVNSELRKVGINAVSDLFLVSYEENFSEEVIRRVKFERDLFISRLEDFFYEIIDPENCNLVTFYQYYSILLLLKKKFGIKVPLAQKNTLSIEKFNLILSKFNRIDIDMLCLKATKNLSYANIASVYGITGSICRKHISNIIDEIKNFSNYILKLEVQTEDEAKNEVDTLIDFLELDNIIRKALKRNNIYTVNELKKAVKEDKIKNIRLIGVKAYDEIIKCLEQYM